MHRFLFHARVTSETGKIVTFLAHGHHHVYPQDPRRIAATPLQLGSLALLFWGAFELALGTRAPIAMAGMLAGYLAYERVHWSAHHGQPRTTLGRALRRYHLAHHHRDPRHHWGIGSPLWDLVFRTTEPPRASAGSEDGGDAARAPGSGP
jgi:dihydroceramide fatty acyl 2-hydroxylase